MPAACILSYGSLIVDGQVVTSSALVVQAGGDLNITSTTQSASNNTGANSFAQTGIDRVAGLYVSGPAGVLLASAGGDLNLTAAQVSNTGTGQTELKAGGSANLALSKIKIKSDYASVTEQSGIKAGDGGFTVNVQGNWHNPKPINIHLPQSHEQL